MTNTKKYMNPYWLGHCPGQRGLCLPPYTRPEVKNMLLVTQRFVWRQALKIATWNVRTLAQTGKLKELEHELKRYSWHVIGLCETRWKSVGENITDDGHVLYYSERRKRVQMVLVFM